MNYKSFSSAILLLFLSLPVFAENQQMLHVSDAWIREAPPAAKVLAAYMVINNHGAQEVTINGATSPQFGHIEIHSTKMANGMARMIREDKLTIPAGKSATFKPGGMHLMLFKPTQAITAGNQVMITLVTADGKNHMVHAEVRKGGMGMMDKGMDKGMEMNDHSHHMH
jgi:copper(I)-binding protein